MSSAAAPPTRDPDHRRALRELVDRGVAMTSLDKVWFPQARFTKADMFDYLLNVAPLALPHLRERPFTLKRFPEGVDGPHFFEKRAPAHTPSWVQTAAQPSARSGDDVDFVLLNGLPEVIWAANLGAFEWHVHLSRAPDLATPLVVVFDLDPGEGAGLRDCCAVALWLRELLEASGLHCHAKTSGSKGLHVYVPLNTGDVDFARSKRFAQAVARVLEQQHPQRITSRMPKEHRRGRVFIDWNQNEDFKSTVAAYSLRALPTPYVSTPVTWNEVERGAASEAAAEGLRSAPADVLARLDRHGDLFEPVLTTTQHIP